MRLLHFLLALVALVGAAPAARAQVPYDPPIVGQAYIYQDWQCVVIAVDGMATRCRLADGGELTLFAGIEPISDGARRPLDAMRRLSCGGRVSTVDAYSLPPESRAALASLWPLAVGNTAQYSIGVTLSFPGIKRANSNLSARTAVTDRKTVAVGADSHEVFVIRQEVAGVCRRQRTKWAYTRTLYYAPALHAVVREDLRWTAGDDRDRSALSELTAPPTAPRPVVVAVTVRPGATSALPQQPLRTAPRPAPSDITAVLDQERPDAAHTAVLRARADAPIDRQRGPERIKALQDRARARIDLSRIPDAMADLTAALEIARNAGQRDQILSLLTIVETQSGNVRNALRYAQQRAREVDRVGRFGAAANLVTAYIDAGEIAEAESLVAQLRSDLLEAIASGRNDEAMAALARFPVAAAEARVYDAMGLYEKAETALDAAMAALDRSIELANQINRPIETLKSSRIALQVRRARLKLREGRPTEAEVVARAALSEALQARGKYAPQTALVVLMLQKAVLEQGRFADSAALAGAAVEILEGIGIAGTSRVLALARVRAAESFAAEGNWSDAASIYERVRSDLATEPAVLRQVFDDDLLYSLTLYRTDHRDAARAAALTIFEARRAVLGDKHYLTAMARGFVAASLADSDVSAALADFVDAVPILLSPSRRADEEDGSRGTRALQERFVLESWLALLAKIEGTALASALPDGPAAEAFRIADALRAQAVQKALAASSARAAARDPGLAALVREEQDARRGIGALLGQLADLLSLPPAQRSESMAKDLETRVDRLRDARAKAREQIEARFPDYVRLVDPRPATIADAETVLRAGEALIATYVAEDATYVWAVAPDKPPSYIRVPLGRAALRDEVALLRVAVDPGPVEFIADIPPFDTAAAHHLFAALLEPLRATWGSSDSLVIVAHGPLGQIPFALLTTEETAPMDTALPFAGYRDVPWLIRSHAIAVLPSVAALAALRDLPPPQASRRPFVGFGDPAFVLAAEDVPVPMAAGVSTRGRPVLLRNLPPERGGVGSVLADLPRLPDTAAEVRSIADAMHADPTRDVFTGSAASERSVKSADLAGYSVVLFATHGLVPGDLDGLDQPALALSAPAAGEDDDGLLTMGEVFELKMDADWVVLSACNTASGDGGGAEAFSGLGRAFFYAGTRAMLLSNWPVESVSARLLTTDVFRRQAENPALGRAQALRQAMLALIDGGIAQDDSGAPLFAYAHPMFWAPFSLVGEGS